MVVCFWFQNFCASRLLFSTPVILYCELHIHHQGWEQRFGMLAEYSYSQENVGKTHAFGHSAFGRVLSVLLLCLLYSLQYFPRFPGQYQFFPGFPMYLMKYSRNFAFESMASHGTNRYNVYKAQPKPGLLQSINLEN